MSVTTMSAPGDEAEAEPKKKGKRKLVAVALVLAMVAVAWWFTLKPAESTETVAPGPVLTLEPIQVNLAAGHYLRIGVALQTSADSATDLDGSKALDATIALFSGQPMEKLATSEQRGTFKKKLVAQLEKRYDGEVIGVYFTDFVTQ